MHFEYPHSLRTTTADDLLDPNALSPDGSVALMAFAPSPDARLLAYTLAEGGADWQTVHVRDLARGEDFADRVRWMRFSALSWTRDGRGFFYSRFPEPPVGRTYEAALSGHALYYQTRQMFATSRDGTRVPFFVTAKRSPLRRHHTGHDVRLWRLLG